MNSAIGRGSGRLMAGALGARDRWDDSAQPHRESRDRRTGATAASRPPIAPIRPAARARSGRGRRVGAAGGRPELLAEPPAFGQVAEQRSRSGRSRSGRRPAHWSWSWQRVMWSIRSFIQSSVFRRFLIVVDPFVVSRGPSVEPTAVAARRPDRGRRHGEGQGKGRAGSRSSGRSATRNVAGRET